MDMIKYVRALEDSELKREQAEVQIQAMDAFMKDNFSTKTDLQVEATGIRHDMKVEFTAVRSEMKIEFAAVRSEMKAEFAAVRNEMNSEFAAVRSEMKAEFAAVRNEVSSEFAAVRSEMATEFAAIRTEMSQLGKRLGDTITNQIRLHTAIVGFVIAVLGWLLKT